MAFQYLLEPEATWRNNMRSTGSEAAMILTAPSAMPQMVRSTRSYVMSGLAILANFRFLINPATPALFSC